MAETAHEAIILNVDDDAAARHRLAQTLEDAGYRVLGSTLDHAVELAERTSPDLVVLRVRPQESRGQEVSRQLRAGPAAAAPILHLSAADEACMVAGLESGADAYLCEPVSEQVVLAQIAALLRVRRLQEELLSARAEAEAHAAQLAGALDQLATANEELQATNEEFAAANEELQTYQDELEQQQEALLQRTQTLEAISRVLDRALTAGSDEDLGEAILAVARELTGSELGFIGEVGPSGSFHDLAINSPSWASCTAYSRADPPRPSGRFAIHGLYQSVLSAGKGFFTNDPASHQSRLGLPEGLPPLSSLLGVPLCQMGQAFGLVAVGNRPGGYTERELQALEALAPAAVQAIQRTRVETALRESEERLALAVEATGLGTFDFLPQTGQLIWSEVAKRHFGLSPEAAVDYNVFLSGLHPEDRERVEAVVQEALQPEHGGHYRADYRTIGLEDHRERWLLAEGRATFDAQGRPVRLIGATLDITARKQAEAALRESEARYRGLFESMQEGFLLAEVVCDASGRPVDVRFLEVNPATEALTGLPREELLGRRVREVLPDLEERWIEVIGRVALTGEPVHLEGQVAPLSREYSVAAYSPRPGLAAVFFTDITERARAEQEREALLRRVQEQAQFLAAFLDNAPVPMAYLDADLRFVRVNQAYADWAGLPSEQLLDHTHFEVWHVEERVETLRQALATGEPVRRTEMPLVYPRRLHRPQGYVDYAAFPVRDEAGRAVGLVLSVEEVTERVHQREQLLAAERARAELAENLNREIAHRTKNNLAMAAGLIQLQAMQQRDPQVGAALAETTARLMAFASIQEEMQATTAGWVELLPVLRRVGSASAGAFAGGNVTVSVEGDAVTLPAKTATNLAVVANELVTNGIKHGAAEMDGRLRIDLELRREGERLRLRVTNSGRPVPEGFDVEGQRGLGLRLVRDLAQQYGGAFTLAPGATGTRAEVVVPLEELQGA